jgi:hypothetical protein
MRIHRMEIAAAAALVMTVLLGLLIVVLVKP